MPPDGQTQDQDFLNAPLHEQHAYLMSTDPDYAQAPKHEQLSYLSSIHQSQYTPAGAAAQPPVARPNETMNKVGLMGEQISPEEEQSIQNRAAHVRSHSITPVTDASSVIMPVAGAVEAGTAGIGRGLKRLTRGAVGAGAGAAAGSYGGGAIGNVIGQREAGSKIGGLVGGVAGGIIGGGSLPEEPQFQQEGGIGASLPSRGEFEAEHEAQLMKEGKLAKVPVRMPKQTPPFEQEGGIGAPLPAAPTQEEILSRAVEEGKAAKLPVKVPKTIPPVTPMTESPYYDKFAASRAAAKEAAANENINRPGWTAKLGTRVPPKHGVGTGGLMGNQDVLTVPEPRPTVASDRPGSKWSLKRPRELPGAAMRGEPGAGEVLSNLRPIIYEPRGGTGYPGPRPEPAGTPPELSGIGGEPKNVMAQTPGTSRATPTGEATIHGGENGQLPPELHADLEKQAGRTLTNEEAIALDRANAERGMARGNGENLTNIREAHRAKLEKKGR